MKIIKKYEIIKKINSGGQGSIYKIKYKNIIYALKIEKILENEIKKNYKSIYWREIEFAQTMNKKYPEKAQKRLLKSNFTKTINNKIRLHPQGG